MDETDPEIAEALKSWFPWWKRPLRMSDWDRLLSQSRAWAEAAIETHQSALDSDAPLFLRQMTASSKFRLYRRYLRLRNRCFIERCRAHEALMREIFSEEESDE